MTHIVRYLGAVLAITMTAAAPPAAGQADPDEEAYLRFFYDLCFDPNFSHVFLLMEARRGDWNPIPGDGVRLFEPVGMEGRLTGWFAYPEVGPETMLAFSAADMSGTGFDDLCAVFFPDADGFFVLERLVDDLGLVILSDEANSFGFSAASLLPQLGDTGVMVTFQNAHSTMPGVLISVLFDVE